MTSAPELSIDFETASLVDLKRAGAKSYSLHPSTRVLCMAYSFDAGKTVDVWRAGQPFPWAVLNHVQAGHKVRGWNVSFEWHIWNNTLLRQIFYVQVNRDAYRLSLAQLDDTMAAAAYWGLPLSLDAAGPAAGVSVQKDKAGHALMMRMCRPRSHNVLTGDIVWWHETDPQKFDQLCDYCAQDVRVEAAIAQTLPPVPASEREIWILDQQINDRGVGLDPDAALKLQALAFQAAGRANVDVQLMTSGQVKTITSSSAFLAYLQICGYPHDNLKKDTVARRLDDESCIGLERELLTLRAENAKTSAAKLQAMLDATTDRAAIGSVYGMLQYYGASRTGRWAGRLIQMQNLPRGEIKNAEAAIQMVLSGASFDMVEALYGTVMAVVTSCLRGCIVARTGKKLVVADFSQIEARVLPWLAGEQSVLDTFIRGADVYIQAAAGIFGVEPDKVTSDQRQIGKVAILALGFGGGAGAFIKMAENYGLTMSTARADQIKVAWRQANPNVVQFWWDCEQAARNAIMNPNRQFTVAGGKITYGMLGPHLICRLPSGRHLVYRDARLDPSKDRPGATEISYMGVDQYTRKWTRLRTYGGKLVENIVQAVARDVMAYVLVEASRSGMSPILTIHDELLCEEDDHVADAALATLLRLMATPPAWAFGLPVKGEGWVGYRYKK